MAIYDHRIVHHGKGQAESVGAHLVGPGAAAITKAGGRMFAVFRPVIGFTVNHVIVLTEWPDERAALQYGAAVLAGLDGCRSVEHDLWEGTVLPKAGTSPAQTSGYYSHRLFDIRPSDWLRFLELSATAWDNFEDAHATKVTGFWKARTAPAPGILRVRLMAWYESLDAWERSRFWNPAAKTGGEASFERFRERATLTQDTGVSILTRIPFPGEPPHPGTHRV